MQIPVKALKLEKDLIREEPTEWTKPPGSEENKHRCLSHYQWSINKDWQQSHEMVWRERSLTTLVTISSFDVTS
eukprot:6337805-Amphidinium_carterae.1